MLDVKCYKHHDKISRGKIVAWNFDMHNMSDCKYINLVLT